MGSELAILVTGSSTGFGYVTSTTLARRGHLVFASMRGVGAHNAAAAGSLRKVAAGEGVRISVLDLDVRDEDSVNAAVESVIGEAGRIDVLINNAGAGCHGILETISVAQAHELFDTNTYSVLRMNRAVLPYMREQRHGLLVHISSGLSRYVLPFYGIYAATKAAVEALAETFRYELASVGVDSVIVEPGPYGTRFFENAAAMRPADEQRAAGYGETLALSLDLASRRPPMGDPIEVAEAIADLIETPMGQRPLRTTVGPIARRADPLNAAATELQRTVFERMGLADLTHAQPAPEADTTEEF